MKLDQLFCHWNQIHIDTLAVLDKFNDVELTCVAYPGGMTVGHIALHIAEAKEGWFYRIAIKQREEWPFEYTLENYPTKAAIQSLLAEIHAKIFIYLSTLTIEDLETQINSPWGQFSLRFIIWHILEHEIHHRGELSLILGILGREGLDV